MNHLGHCDLIGKTDSWILIKNFIKKIEGYDSKDKNENLVAPISGIRFPVLRSFWTDDEDLFPSSNTERIWWEVWIRVVPTENSDDAFAEFVPFYNELYGAIKEASPDTKVFTVFQLEKMKGLKMWEIEESEPHWEMINTFNDIVKKTTLT